MPATSTKSLHDANGKRLHRNGKALLGADGDACCCANPGGCCPCPCLDVDGTTCIKQVTAQFNSVALLPDGTCIREFSGGLGVFREYAPLSFTNADLNSTFNLDYCPQYCFFIARTDLYIGMYRFNYCARNQLLRKQRLYVNVFFRSTGVPGQANYSVTFIPTFNSDSASFFGAIFDSFGNTGPCRDVAILENQIADFDEFGLAHHGTVTLTPTFGTSANTDPQKCTGCSNCYRLHFTILGVDYQYDVFRRLPSGACDCQWTSDDGAAGLTRGCNYWHAGVVLPEGTTTEPEQGSAVFSVPVDGTGCPPLSGWTIDDAEPSASLTITACVTPCSTDVSTCCTASATAVIQQTGSGINGADINQQWDNAGVLPLTSTDGQVSTTLECFGGNKWRFTVYVTSDPTLYVTYEEDPDSDGCPPTLYTNKIANTWGVDPSATVTITC